VASFERVREEAATLVFTPDRLAVVKAGPSVRRAYVDRALGRLFPARATLAAEYAEVLGQRNAALRRVTAGLIGEDAVGPWTERLAAAGADLSSARSATIAALEQPFAEQAEELGLANASLDYEDSPVTADVLETRLGRDLERGTTGTGPHLDEVRIAADGHELRTHGSQGEQRVAVLAILLAEAELLGRTRRVPPLLLLDDVLSELDGDRRTALVERVRGSGQVLVTAAARGALPGSPDQMLEISPGRVLEA
jgi:DNA replication and repair protein RecF